VNARDPEGNTLLHQILLQGRLSVSDRPPASWLARVQPDSDRKTYLKYLTVDRYQQGPNALLQTLSFLLACGADAAATNGAGQTALRLVTDQKSGSGGFFFDDERTQAMQLLSAHGGRINQADADGNTALHRVVVGYPAIFGDKVTELIATGANVNATNLAGRTPLHLAVVNVGSWPGEGGPDNGFLALLKAKADVNAQDLDGLTPLHVLASGDSMFKQEAMGALLAHGAEPNRRDKLGRTPAHVLLSGKWPWSGAPECLGLLVKAGADLSAADAQGKTPLHYLAAAGSQSSMFFMRGIGDIFVAAKVDLKARDKNGDTPLHIAARTGTQDVLDWLVSRGGNLDATNHAGETARLMAARSNTRRFGAPNAETDIFAAVWQGKLESVARLLSADRSLANATNQFGQTPLRIAVQAHRTNLVELLEKNGVRWDEVSAVLAGRADVLREILQQWPSAVTNTSAGTGLLHLAADNGDLDIIRMLLAAKGNVRATDPWGLSPLGHALVKNKAEVAVLLRQHGAVENCFDAVYANDLKTLSVLVAQDKSLVSATNPAGASAAETAAGAGHADILKLLLDKHAPVNAINARDGNTPLHVAAVYGQTNTARLLVQQGAKVQLYNHAGFTPLHLAALHGSTALVSVLLKGKANPNTPVIVANDPQPMPLRPGLPLSGDTPLHLAALSGQTNLIEALLKAGAAINATNAMGWTALDLADQRGLPPTDFWLRRGLARTLAPVASPEMPPGNPSPALYERRKAAAAMLESHGGKRSPARRAYPGPFGF
jgi:ankyrin repeat protein